MRFLRVGGMLRIPVGGVFQWKGRRGHCCKKLCGFASEALGVSGLPCLPGPGTSYSPQNPANMFRWVLAVNSAASPTFNPSDPGPSQEDSTVLRS